MDWLKVERIDKSLPLPTKATEGSFGFDLYAAKDVTIYSQGEAIIPLGVRVEIPVGYVGVLKSRSGFGFKHSVESHQGWIDSDFRGELNIKLYNLADYKTLVISKGDRVAQIGIFRAPCMVIKEVDKVGDTVRGEGGFGSTGA